MCIQRTIVVKKKVEMISTELNKVEKLKRSMPSTHHLLQEQTSGLEPTAT